MEHLLLPALPELAPRTCTGNCSPLNDGSAVCETLWRSRADALWPVAAGWMEWPDFRHVTTLLSTELEAHGRRLPIV